MDSKENVLEDLANILRKHGYRVDKPKYDDSDLPTIEEWLRKEANLSSRAWHCIYERYCYVPAGGKAKSLRDLIEDVRSGEITNQPRLGKKTYEEIRDELRSSLHIHI